MVLGEAKAGAMAGAEAGAGGQPHPSVPPAPLCGSRRTAGWCPNLAVWRQPRMLLQSLGTDSCSGSSSRALRCQQGKLRLKQPKLPLLRRQHQHQHQHQTRT